MAGKLSLTGLLVCVLLALGSAAICQGTLSALTWPQPLNLGPGEKAVYAIPMTQAGEIAVLLKWTGAPCVVALTDPAGVAVTPTSKDPTDPPSAKVSYTISATDLKKGALWTLSVVAPGQLTTGARPVASGQIWVQSPPVSAEQLALICKGTREKNMNRLKGTLPRSRLPARHTPSIFGAATEEACLNFTRAKVETDAGLSNSAVNPNCAGVYFPLATLVPDVNQQSPTNIMAALSATDKPNAWTYDDETLYVKHMSSWLCCELGHDTFLRNYQLKNGWVFKNAEYAITCDGDQGVNGGAYEKRDAAISASCPLVIFSYWDAPIYNTVCYWVKIHISGPKGLPYQ